jgi:hypothetical protein
LKSFLVFLSLLVVFACVKSGTGSDDKSPKSCEEIRDSVFPNSILEPQYRVVSPNGGEIFHLGQKMKVILTAKDDFEAIAFLIIRTGTTSNRILLPEAPRGSFDPSVKCDLSFTIPDSIDTGLGKKLTLVSDSVKILVGKYNNDNDFFDYSDAYFSILP